MLHQHEWRAQAGLDVRVPGGARGVVPFVALERAGVVHQNTDRAECRAGLRQQRLWSAASSVRSAGNSVARRPRRRIASQCFDARDAAGVAMHCDIEASACQGERDGATDALRPTGNQGGAWDAGGNVVGQGHGGDGRTII